VSGLAARLTGAPVTGSRLKRFQDAIEREGRILHMIDVSDEHADTVENLVKARSPDVEVAGFAPRAPIVPT
jgi:hypothetical protein